MSEQVLAFSLTKLRSISQVKRSNISMHYCLSSLQDYISQVPIWLQTVEAMHRSVLESLENDHVDYLDVRKCYFENLHLLTQWISSLNSRYVQGFFSALIVCALFFN